MKKLILNIIAIISFCIGLQAQTKAKFVLTATDEYGYANGFKLKADGTEDYLSRVTIRASQEPEVSILSNKAVWFSDGTINCYYLKIKRSNGEECNIPIANLDVDAAKYGLKVRSFETAIKGITDVKKIINHNYVSGSYIYKSSKGQYVIVNSNVKTGSPYNNSILIYTLNANKAEENGIMGYSNYKELGLTDSDVKISSTPSDVPSSRMFTFLNQKRYSVLIHQAKANEDFNPDESDMITTKDMKDIEKGKATLLEVKSTKVVLYNNDYFIKVVFTTDPFSDDLLNKFIWINIRDVNIGLQEQPSFDGNIQIDKEKLLVIPYKGK
jgi:hypothetical protein